ncbi:chromosome replication/partitioning protein (plasmid) [Borrelia miyamotoi]|uniref:Chromosome replication/partitioning protein n=2 Tax=Borrelia miyamotoi TaxID=47466 RepID=A0AAQ3CM43_9SPIR|nr:chromosome replication/partitioning protein [Borrelia miyamotoi]AHH05720.1 Putative plasmid partition protein [Borrelia miyamotoi FR64b]ATQ15310.1 chromosome replication/partitioning protein [Borrelia miyamotoi]ATQ16493.1 chromosome replication/partitioning protein [Borrelia miyamotoi]ATQ17640.1 chromosome replication/partitioning protein [Borrelia miyamotoi]ATQ18909.1 chromosome replication/partitioning protein [Borrelia miyamotoi]
MKNVVLSNRILDTDENTKSLEFKNENLDRYNELKEKLKQNARKEIYYKVENIRILKEIKDNEYYKLDGHKNFDNFIKSYRMAKTQVYAYLRLANAIEDGLLAEQYIIENGINESLAMIKNKESVKIKKSRQNPIKPLRFQLKSQDSYDFYKEHSKFTAFILDTLFSNDKNYLDKLFKQYSGLKLRND